MAPPRGWTPGTFPPPRLVALASRWLASLLASGSRGLLAAGGPAPPTCCSSRSTRCAPIMSAYTAHAGQTPRPSMPSPRAASASSTPRAPFRSRARRTPRSSPACTRPSTASATTSSSPSMHATRPWPRSSRRRATVRRAFVAAYPVAAAFGFRQGFDIQRGLPGEPGPGRGRPAAGQRSRGRGPRLAGQAGQTPFFVWVHLYDPHAPYDPPEPYRRAFAGPAVRRRDRVRGRPARTGAGAGFGLGHERTPWSPCSPTTASRSGSTAR